MNKAAASLSYFFTVQDQVLANLCLALTMLATVGVMAANKLFVFSEPSY